MEEGYTGLGGNYRCTIPKRAARIGQDQTKNGDEGDSLTCSSCWVIALGELSILFFKLEGRQSITFFFLGFSTRPILQKM